MSQSTHFANASLAQSALPLTLRASLAFEANTSGHWPFHGGVWPVDLTCHGGDQVLQSRSGASLAGVGTYQVFASRRGFPCNPPMVMDVVSGVNERFRPEYPRATFRTGQTAQGATVRYNVPVPGWITLDGNLTVSHREVHGRF
jgi:hypothetical protein